MPQFLEQATVLPEKSHTDQAWYQKGASSSKTNLVIFLVRTVLSSNRKTHSVRPALAEG
jgi:hypothetical protein